MKTILITIAVLALTFTSCKNNSIAPATQPASSNVKQDSLYRNIGFEVWGDSIEMYINDVKFHNNTYVMGHDTIEMYYETKIFYPGDVIKIRVVKTNYQNTSLYPNGHSSVFFTQYRNAVSFANNIPQQMSTDPIAIYTFTVK